MRYSDGSPVRTGDVIRMGDAIGRIVCDIDDRACEAPHNIDDWIYLGRGILADFESLGLIHMEIVESDIELVRRADEGG